jgi:hypothetical protein
MFPVPALAEIPDAGRVTELKIWNIKNDRCATHMLTVFPKIQLLAGNAYVDWTVIEPNPIVPASRALFGAKVDLDLTTGTEVRVMPEISRPEWQSRLKVLDSDLNDLPGGVLIASEGSETHTVFVALDVPSTAKNETFTLNITVGAGSVEGISETLFAQVGEQVANPSAVARVNLIGMQSSAPAKLNGRALSVTAGERARLNFELEELQEGIAYEILLAPSGQDWKAWLDVPGDKLQKYTFVPTAGTRHFSFAIIVEALLSASADGSLDLMIKRADSVSENHHVFRLLKQ